MDFFDYPGASDLARQYPISGQLVHLTTQDDHLTPKGDRHRGYCPEQSKPYDKPSHCHGLRLIRNLYPSPRTVTIRFAAGPSFSRSRRTCVSTVRVSSKFSYRHTSQSKVSRERVLPRRSTITASSLNSVVVRSSRLPLTVISKLPLSI